MPKGGSKLPAGEGFFQIRHFGIDRGLHLCTVPHDTKNRIARIPRNIAQLQGPSEYHRPWAESGDCLVQQIVDARLRLLKDCSFRPFLGASLLNLSRARIDLVEAGGALVFDESSGFNLVEFTERTALGVHKLHALWILRRGRLRLAPWLLRWGRLPLAIPRTRRLKREVGGRRTDEYLSPRVIQSESLGRTLLSRLQPACASAVS